MTSSAAAEAKKSAGTAWTPTGGRSITVSGPHPSSGKFYLQTKYDPRSSSKKPDRNSITSSHDDYPGAPALGGCLPQKQWSTRAAAEAAIPHFRAWVDGGRRKQTAAATAVSNRSDHSPWALALSSAQRLPERYSKRQAMVPKVDLKLSITSGSSGPVVVAHLGTSRATLARDELNEAWSERASALHKLKQQRREHAAEAAHALQEALAGAQGQGESAMRVALRNMGPRGKSRRNFVSMYRCGGNRAKPEQHAKQREIAHTKRQERMEEAATFRVQHIERLKGVLLSGSVAELLDRTDEEAGEALSAAQTQRLTTQGWALVHMYKEVGRLEQAISSGLEKLPNAGVLETAMASAAAEFGFSLKTMRSWRLEYETLGFKFAADARGKWARELLIHEEDLQRKFHKWMVVTAKDEKLSVEAALEYLNGTLLRPPHVTSQMLADYRIVLPITNYTAWFWMKASGAQAGKFQQSYYNDHHEAEFVKKDRSKAYKSHRSADVFDKKFCHAED